MNGNLAITYTPKIEGVKQGWFRQTIRKGRRFRLYDKVHIFGWAGKPYRSKWAWRRDEILVDVVDIHISTGGIIVAGYYHTWGSDYARILAKEDGIDPPNGHALKCVMEILNGPIPPEGWEAQILRW